MISPVQGCPEERWLASSRAPSGLLHTLSAAPSVSYGTFSDRIFDYPNINYFSANNIRNFLLTATIVPTRMKYVIQLHKHVSYNSGNRPGSFYGITVNDPATKTGESPMLQEACLSVAKTGIFFPFSAEPR